MANADTRRLAVLIDADNATSGLTSELMAEIAKYGTPTIKRAYGDWTTPNLAGFAIVSSDSDFTRLVTRLRESGKTVYGLGRRDTPDAFVKACDRFIYLELLGAEPAEPARPRSPDLVRLPRAAQSRCAGPPARSMPVPTGADLPGHRRQVHRPSTLSRRPIGYDPL